jgi:hypothetical protein
VKGTAAREFRITSSTKKSDSSLRSRTQKKPSCLAMERATAAPPTARGETLRVSPNCAWSNGEAAVQQSTGPSLAFMTAADGPRGFLVLLSGPRDSVSRFCRHGARATQGSAWPSQGTHLGAAPELRLEAIARQAPLGPCRRPSP